MTELKPGCIFFDIKFTFKDNEIGEKLIVLLNNPGKEESFLFCRTTSKEKPPYQIKTPNGCQRNSQYFFIKACNFFPKDTWLLLCDIYEYDKAFLLKKAFDKEIKILNSIDDTTLRQIKNCIKYSEKHLKMILKTIV
jgi:hypothetical protein